MIEISEKILIELEKPEVTGAPGLMLGPALVQFDDDVTISLGDDQQLFERIADHMMSGNLVENSASIYQPFWNAFLSWEHTLSKRQN
jgi:hypothetical protein